MERARSVGRPRSSEDSVTMLLGRYLEPRNTDDLMLYAKEHEDFCFSDTALQTLAFHLITLPDQAAERLELGLSALRRFDDRGIHP